MKLAIINGSIRTNNTTAGVVKRSAELAGERTWHAKTLNLDTFREFFRGDYITLDTATQAQQKMIQSLIDAEALLFVVPSYYKSMPGALKNFFDIVRVPEIYDGKVVAIMQSNHKNQDYAAQTTETVLKAIATFHDLRTVFVHELVIVHPEAIDDTHINHCLDMLDGYRQMIRR